jgi:hypothetical protein
MYQVYQLSVSNFADNELFATFALDDLAQVLQMKLVVFHVKPQLPDEYEVKIYEPCNSSLIELNDIVFLSVNPARKIKYKWLLPKRAARALMESSSTILKANAKMSETFIKLKPSYMRYVIQLDTPDLYARFDRQFLHENANYTLFLKFLSECSVHTLVSLKKLDFDVFTANSSSSDAHIIIRYLNQLWGQRHFNLREILDQAELDYELEVNP